jgi:hypothetical protein
MTATRVLDDCLVGLVLLVSAAYLISALGPRALRVRTLSALAALAARAPPYLGLRRISLALSAAAGARSQGACGGCGSCASEPAANAKPASEVSIPVAEIRRRK